MAENPKVPTNKKCELGEAVPNRELKGEKRWEGKGDGGCRKEEMSAVNNERAPERTPIKETVQETDTGGRM